MREYVRAWANVSRCGRYRCVLGRQWGPGTAIPYVLWIMLNPSTADGSEDDPTVRRCVDYANCWGYEAMRVVNLYDWRATYPRDLARSLQSFALHGLVSPISPECDLAIREQGAGAALVVAAWGANVRMLRMGRNSHGIARACHVTEMIRAARYDRTLHVLGFTKSGQPVHPLMQRADLIPQVWKEKR